MLHRVNFDAFVDYALKHNSAIGRYIFNSSNINRMIHKNVFEYSYDKSVYQKTTVVR